MKPSEKMLKLIKINFKQENYLFPTQNFYTQMNNFKSIETISNLNWGKYLRTKATEKMQNLFQIDIFKTSHP